MVAHRVGTLGAIFAVLILSVELLGAIAWKHHAVAVRHDHVATSRASVDSALEQVTLARDLLERDY